MFYLAWRVVEVICFIQSRTDLVHKKVYSMTLPINKAPCTVIRAILKLPLLNSSVHINVSVHMETELFTAHQDHIVRDFKAYLQVFNDVLSRKN